MPVIARRRHRRAMARRAALLALTGAGTYYISRRARLRRLPALALTGTGMYLFNKYGRSYYRRRKAYRRNKFY